MVFLCLLLLLVGTALPTSAAVLDSIRAALNYYHSKPGRLSNGVLFGVLLLEGQLYSTNILNKDMQNEVHRLIRICDSIIESNPRAWLNIHLAKRLAQGIVSLKKVDRHLREGPRQLDYELEDNLLSGSPSPQESSYCILEAMEGQRISSNCFIQETDPHAKGYTLSHQAIYFLLSSAMKTSPSITEPLLRKLCGKIISEVYYSWSKGLPRELTDLFIEEVAVCGLGNFKEFLTEPTLDMILSLLQEEGCFSTRKLENVSADEKCDDHLSAVSIVALGNFLPIWNKS